MDAFDGLRLEERLDGGGEFAFYLGSRSTPYRGGGERVVILRASLDVAERRWPPWVDPGLARLLHHPAIVRMLEEGATGSHRYFVFENMDGGDLRRLLPLGPMSFSASMVVAGAVVDALVSAHAAVDQDGTLLHFVHGNVAPRWVFLSRNGTVKLGGFGFRWLKPEQPERKCLIAHLVDASPENVFEAGYDTAQGDMYQLGALLFLLLFGLPYVSSARAPRLARVGHPLAATPMRDSPARGLLTRLLADEPKDRFGSMAEVRAALDACPHNEGEGRAALVELVRRSWARDPSSPSMPPCTDDVANFEAPRGGQSELMTEPSHGSFATPSGALVVPLIPVTEEPF